jgi:hypothetical protein
MALHETAMLSSASVISGTLYVVANATNENGTVVVSPITGTVAHMLTALGLPSNTVVKNCDVPSRSTGAFTGPNQRGLDIFET